MKDKFFLCYSYMDGEYLVRPYIRNTVQDVIDGLIQHKGADGIYVVLYEIDVQDEWSMQKRVRYEWGMGIEIIAHKIKADFGGLV